MLILYPENVLFCFLALTDLFIIHLFIFEMASLTSKYGAQAILLPQPPEKLKL
jgi:hypothetical protein